jgi:allophanate hydrolase
MISAPPESRRSLQIAALRRAYRSGELTVAALIEDLIERLAQWNDPALWITPVVHSALRTRARLLDARAAEERERLPLFGIPFAV